MEKVLLLYKNNHASHRVISSTMDNYNYYGGYKSKLDLRAYCIGKRGALRLDRYLLKENFDAVYVHEEHIDTIELLKELNQPIITYTRSDFCIYRMDYRNESTVTYTLLNEIIHKVKQQHGKVKVYYTNGDKINYIMKFRSDLEANRGKYFEVYNDALAEQINIVKKWKAESIKDIEYHENLIYNKKKKLIEIDVKLSSLAEKLVV